ALAPLAQPHGEPAAQLGGEVVARVDEQARPAEAPRDACAPRGVREPFVSCAFQTPWDRRRSVAARTGGLALHTLHAHRHDPPPVHTDTGSPRQSRHLVAVY